MSATVKKTSLLENTSRPLIFNILLYTIPLMLTNILNLAFNTADTIVVGRFAGGDALAAVGSAGPLFGLINNCLMGLSVGTSVTMTHSWGAKKEEDIKKTVHTAILTSAIGGLLVMTVGLIISKQCLAWMGTPDNIIAGSTLYIRICFLSLPANMVFAFGAAILRSTGDTKNPLLFLVSAGVLNVVLNLLFVCVFSIGVAGVALATAISQVFSAFLIIRFLMHQNTSYRLNLRELRIDPKKFVEILRIGFPASIQSCVFSVADITIQSSVNSFGSAAIEGNTAAANLGGFVAMVTDTFYTSALTFIGYHIGTGELKKITKILLVCISLALISGLIAGSAVFVFAEQLLSVYCPDNPESVYCGAIRVRIVYATYMLAGVMHVFTGSMRGIGSSFTPMLISLIGICATRILWIRVVFQMYPSLEILYLCFPVSWVLTITSQAIAFTILRHRLMLRSVKP